MIDTSHNSSSEEVVNQQVEKNRLAIEKLKSELIGIQKKIEEGEKNLEESRELLNKYVDITERIVSLDKKMKMSKNVPPKIKAHFETLVQDAEVIENELATKGVRSMEEFNKLLKVNKDNREMYDKFSDMIKNIETQNEYYKGIATKSILGSKEKTKKVLKGLLSELKSKYNITLTSMGQLKDEITSTESKVKMLLMKKNIADESYENFRLVEKHLATYQNCKENSQKLDAEFLNSNKKNKDPSKIETYKKYKKMLERQIRLEIKFFKKNNISGTVDFEEKDSINKNLLNELIQEIDKLNKKLGILDEISKESKKM